MPTNNLPVVLYLDLEMGESAIKERFKIMCEADGIDAPSLYVKYFPGANLLDEVLQKTLERWLVELKVDILIVDPIGNAWEGDENNKQEVSKLTAYLNKLIEKYKISIVVTHHFRKATKGFTSGGEMAAGSYKWSAWLDNHITLKGDCDNITVSCEKSRNRSKFKAFRAKINRDALNFEYLGDFEKTITEQTLLELFEHFNSARVAIPELIKYAKSISKGSHSTLRALIAVSHTFGVDKTGSSHYLYKKVIDRSLFGDADIQDAEISTDFASE